MLFLLAGAPACDDGGSRAGLGQSPPARAFEATVATAWFDELYRVVKRNGTSPFPSYTSGHSTQSGAAAAVLTAYFGPIPFTDTTHQRLNPERALGTRTFRNFLQAAGEAAVSRLYGGIHYVFDNQDGFDQGLCIGAAQNAQLRFTE